MLLWEEYKGKHPDGIMYTQFCEIQERQQCDRKGRFSPVAKHLICAQSSAIAHYDENVTKKVRPHLSTFAELHNILDIFESSSGIEDIKHWFMSIYESSINTMEMEKDTYKEEIILKVQEYIKSNFSNPMLSINDISLTVNLSPNYLRSVFKEATGETISEYISKHRFEMAYSLLKSTNYTTAKIAEMTGFNSTTYFYTAFKKRFGITPDNYRKRITS